jgi:hypothetical protein
MGMGIPVEHRAQEAGFARAVLDQKESGDRGAAYPLSCCCGNLALTSQNELMLCTRLSNASSSTGLLR